MKKKLLATATVAGIAGLVLGGFTIEKEGISALIEEKIANFSNIEQKKEIANQVLLDTGKSEIYNINDLEQVEIYFGNITENDERDVVISVSFGPKNTILAVYTNDGNSYEYLGTIGDFYEIKKVSFIPIDANTQDVIIVNEFANQGVGAYEQSELLRGYFYKDDEFQNVLSTPIVIEAAWNELWENNEIITSNQWKKVLQTSDVTWKTTEAPTTLDIKKYQRYLTVDNDDQKTVPKKEEFVEQDKRVVSEHQKWSDTWQRFIVGEGVEISSGETVAIVEIRDDSPYAMSGYIENSYGIQRQDGTYDIVKTSEISTL
ncbi:MAG: hypothetical protein R3Y53_02655 [Bacillota bacterium]